MCLIGFDWKAVTANFTYWLLNERVQSGWYEQALLSALSGCPALFTLFGWLCAEPQVVISYKCTDKNSSEELSMGNGQIVKFLGLLQGL